jgi:FixJ family two-component response regulator
MNEWQGGKAMDVSQETVVYVVDDDQGMLDSTVWLLESVGLKALAFTSGRDFLDACSTEAHGCVLLDVRMPGLGGLSVQEEMRRRGIELPVIFVSGHADVPIVIRAFKAGAVDFIEKPYNEQLLLDSVQQSLQSRAHQHASRAGLGELDERLALPRRATPRTRVPAGSLAIAERQTAIYPQASPGGWHLLGHTPLRLFDAQREPPCPLALGDRVRFLPIDAAAFRRAGGRA